MRAHAQISNSTQSPSSGAGLFMELFDVIGELARRRHQAGERAFATIGLNHTEGRLLGLLIKEGNGTATQDVLSSKLHVDRTNAGRALQRLERDGYIVRRKDDGDKRSNHVEITPVGRKAVVQISKLRKEIAETLFGKLEEDEARRVLELLRKTL
jgi:MarR family transcriptional regulator, transcriptional regulator for hemolysin